MKSFSLFVLLLLPCNTDNVDDLLEQEEADHGHESSEAQPDGLLVLIMVVAMTMMVPAPGLAHLGQEGVRQEVEQGVTGEGPHRQGDEELDEVLVEDPLHDRDHQDTEHSAQRDQDQGT